MRIEYPLPDWWDTAVRASLKRNWHSFSAHHAIYHVFLNDLNTIIIDNRPFIELHIHDLESLILDIERFNVCRRKIAHTKYLNSNEIIVLDNLYNKSKKIINFISKKLDIVIP